MYQIDKEYKYSNRELKSEKEHGKIDKKKTREIYLRVE